VRGRRALAQHHARQHRQPQNQSGVRITHDEIRELPPAMTALAPEAWLFVDETHREAVYGNDPVSPSAAGLGPRVLTGASISRAHGSPGLRVGWVTVPDRDLRKRSISVSCSVTGRSAGRQATRQG
jgi:aspartate/methionine/tyrosine aminotransferase